ncbi:MAG: methionine/alanine import family NSS transporter small subunit [Gemmatimonadota bacterium]|nr:MAG: methionine/alanine import family NSS transporter small subunit [Gemmatimonadota bacterium]
MSTSAIVAMLLTCGFIWGGFLILLAYAIRRERDKSAQS